MIDSGNTVQILDAHSRRPAHRITGTAVSVVRFSPDGRLLAVGDRHDRVRIYSTATGRPITRAFPIISARWTDRCRGCPASARGTAASPISPPL